MNGSLSFSIDSPPSYPGPTWPTNRGSQSGQCGAHRGMGSAIQGQIRQAPGAHRLVGWLQIGWAATIQLGGLWGHVLFEHGWPASYMGHTKNPNCSSH